MLDTFDPLSGYSKPNENEFKKAVRLLGFRARWNDGDGGGDGAGGGDGDGSGDGDGKGGDGAGDGKDGAGKDGAAGADSWLSGVDDGIRQDPSLTRYKNVNELAKGHISLNTKIGAKGIIIPNKDAPQEEIDAYYNAQGRPETSEGYVLNKPEGLHESVVTTPESEKDYKGVAHKLGLTATQADGLNAWYLEKISNLVKQDAESIKTETAQAETKLMGEWGNTYPQNLELSKRAINKFGGEEALNALTAASLDNHPAIIKMMAAVGKAVSEDAIDKLGVSDLSTTPAMAGQKIKEIQGNPKHPYWVEDDPLHKEAVQEVARLYKIAEGGN